MSLAVGSIYLPCHLVSLLKSLGTATFGFLEIFNNVPANNIFSYWAFPSLALLRCLSGTITMHHCWTFSGLCYCSICPFPDRSHYSLAEDH